MNNLLEVHAINHTHTHTAELTGEGRIEAANTVNAKLEYLSIEGASYQEVTEASKNLFNAAPYQDDLSKFLVQHNTAVWVELDGKQVVAYNGAGHISYVDFGVAFAPNTQYTISGYAGSVSVVVTRLRLVIWYTDGTADYLQLGVTAVGGVAYFAVTSASEKSIKSIAIDTGSQKVYLDIASWQIEEGATATDYEPYYPAKPSPENPSPIQSLEDFDVVVRGDNLLDIKAGISNLGANSNSPTAFSVSGGTITFYRPEGTYNQMYAYFPLELVPNTTYTIHFDSVFAVSLDGTETTSHTAQTGIYKDDARVVTGLAPYRFTTGEDASGYVLRVIVPGKIVQMQISGLMLTEGITAVPYTPYYHQSVHVPYALREIGDVKDQLTVDTAAKTVSITRQVDPDALDPTKSIYDNPEQYLLDNPVTEDITATETGQELLQLTSCYPACTTSVTCANGLTGSMQAQVLVLGR